MSDQSCSDGSAILGYGMLLGLKSSWRRTLHWLSQMSQQRLPGNLVCWSSATWPNKKGRIEKMIMERMKHVYIIWTIWLFEWEIQGMKLKLCSYVNAKLWCHGSTLMSWWLRQPLLARRAGVSPCTCLRLQGKVSWLRCQKSLGMVEVIWGSLNHTYRNAPIKGYNFEVSRSFFGRSHLTYPPWCLLLPATSWPWRARPACGCYQLRWWHCDQSNLAKGT